MARRSLSASQHDEPQPPTTSTALPAAGTTADGAASCRVPEAEPAPWPAPTRAAATFDAGLIGNWIVPVNSSRAVPTTRATTITAAIGANGRLNSSLAASDSCGRGCNRAARTARPYKALALTRPVTAATARAAPTGRRVITAPATVAAAK